MDSINTERSYTEYEVTEPTTDFAIGFDNYSGEDKDAIHITLDGVNLDDLDYTVVRKNAQTIEVTPAIESGVLRLQRETAIDQAFHKFTAGALFSPKSMDENFAQVRHSQQEVNDGFTFLAKNTNGVVAAADAATARANAAAEATEAAIEDAQDLVELVTGSVLFTVQNLAAGRLTTVPSKVTHVRTQAYSAVLGGARYVRSTAAITATYPTSAWFKSADGAYWLLDEDKPDPTMFGGKPVDSMSLLTATEAIDSTGVLTAARQYALKHKVPLYFTGYYMWVGDLTPETGERFIGTGRTNCGIQTKTEGTTYQAGVKITNNNNVIFGMELQAYLHTPKLAGGGTGMVGVSLLVGNYSDGSLSVPKGYYIDDVLLTRKDNETDYTSYNGIAMQVSGGANVGYVGLVEIAGRHSGAYMSHWTGNSNIPHDPVSQTLHPRNFTIDKLVVSDHVDTLITLSAVANLTINSVYAVSCAKALTVLAGDEADNFNIGAADVGAGVHFGSFVVDNVTALGKAGFDEGMGITSLATSKFQMDATQLKQQQLRTSITIDTLTMHTSDPDTIYGIDLFYYFGLFHVKAARLTGFKYPLRALNSRGDIAVNFEYTDGACVIKDSDVKITGSIEMKDRYVIPYGNPWAVIVEVSPFEVAINNYLRGATTLTVPTGLPFRIERGAVFEITGTINGSTQTVRHTATKFAQAGATTIDLGVVFQSNCNTATLKYIGTAEVDIDVTRMTGSYVGVYAKGGNVKVRGKLQSGKYNVHAYGINTVVDYNISTAVSGEYRLEGSTTTLYDLFIEAGATAVVSGTLGAGKSSDIGLYRSIGSISSGARNKVNIRNATIVDKTKVIDLTQNIACTVTGSVTTAGARYTIIDAYGRTATGTNANGSYVLNEDGTMSCWARNLPITGTPHVWTFPTAFIETSSISVTGTSGNPTSTRTVVGYADSVTTASISIRDATGAITSAGANLHAIGFWK